MVLYLNTKTSLSDVLPIIIMFAIIKTGGKQYIVRAGQELKIEKVAKEVGESIVFDVLLLADEDKGEVKVGAPIIDGAIVSAKVTAHGRDDKKRIVKFKAKSRYRRHTSHRQPYTKIKIEKIS